jgi:hypothetical protein
MAFIHNVTVDARDPRSPTDTSCDAAATLSRRRNEARAFAGFATLCIDVGSPDMSVRYSHYLVSRDARLPAVRIDVHDRLLSA